MLKKKAGKTNIKGKVYIRFFAGTIYAKVNSWLAGVIGLIFIYSGFFSPEKMNHLLHSMYSNPVASTGLSRAFSAIVRGDFERALQLNPFSIHIFLFFAIQCLLRLFINLLLINEAIPKKLLLYFDVFLSVLLFLWAFKGLVLYQLQLITM